MTKTDFENLVVGNWISTNSGVFEVSNPYDENTKMIKAKDVVFSKENSDEYTLGETNYFVFSDVQKATFF